MEMFVFTGLVVRDGDSYSALCPELDVATQGASAGEARERLLEAAALHLEGAFEDGLPYLRPIPREEDPRLTAPERMEEECSVLRWTSWYALMPKPPMVKPDDAIAALERAGFRQVLRRGNYCQLKRGNRS